MNASLRSIDHRTVSLLDGVAVFWAVLWFVIGGVTSYEIWQLSSLSDTAEVSAEAVDRAGEALQAIGELPLVGEGPGDLGDEVRAAADEVGLSADRTRVDVRRLSVVLGLSVFLIPVSPVLGLYVPLRLGRRREVAAIRRGLDARGLDPSMQSYLAQRAVQSLSFDELRRVTSDPTGDLEQGRYGALATAELDRLGLRAPDRATAPAQGPAR